MSTCIQKTPLFDLGCTFLHFIVNDPNSTGIFDTALSKFCHGHPNTFGNSWGVSDCLIDILNSLQKSCYGHLLELHKVGC